MRAVWKLSVIVLLGVAAQCGVVHCADDIDDAAFTFRVFCAARAGVPFDDPELVEAARQLFRRQCRRDGRCVPYEPYDGAAELLVASAGEF